MSDTSTTLRQYPPPDKRKKTIIPPSPSLTSISEKTDEKSESIEIDQFIESQVGLVSKNNIERSINSLTSFHNRHSKSIYIHQVASWLKKELEISGYKDKDKIKDEDKDRYKDVVEYNEKDELIVKYKFTEDFPENYFDFIYTDYLELLPEKYQETLTKYLDKIAKKGASVIHLSPPKEVKKAS